MRSRLGLWGSIFALALGAAFVVPEASAAKNIQVDAKELRSVHLAEVGMAKAPPRVVVTFSLPGDKTLYGVVCARKAATEDPANCAVIDDKGTVVDDSVGLNVMRVKAKGAEKLELLFAAQWAKQHVRVAAIAPLDPAFIDSVATAFVADLSMIEFMSADEGFPIGVSLDGGGKLQGADLVLGTSGNIPMAEAVAQLRKAPPPLAKPEPPQVADATADGAAAPDPGNPPA